MNLTIKNFLYDQSYHKLKDKQKKTGKIDWKVFDKRLITWTDNELLKNM